MASFNLFPLQPSRVLTCPPYFKKMQTERCVLIITIHSNPRHSKHVLQRLRLQCWMDQSKPAQRSHLHRLLTLRLTRSMAQDRQPKWSRHHQRTRRAWWSTPYASNLCSCLHHITQPSLLGAAWELQPQLRKDRFRNIENSISTHLPIQLPPIQRWLYRRNRAHPGPSQKHNQGRTSSRAFHCHGRPQDSAQILLTAFWEEGKPSSHVPSFFLPFHHYSHQINQKNRSLSMIVDRKSVV